jgi:putative transposase
VQIDHTPLDIILVDEIYRKPLQRPWVTLAFDVYSRMVMGFYISFDPPGALGTGMCLAHAILPKEMWLAKHDIQGEWPCWGVMGTIHADNAKEFRGNMLRRAAEEYGINLEWREVKRPNWGGHIERYLGTLLKEIHTLPGTTFSNIKERKTYNSEAQSALTLTELEKWLTTYIVQVYHKRFHTGIKTSPIAKYNEGIFGSGQQKGIGIPKRIFNERKVKLDFLPFVERTIQEYGVQIEHIHYYDDKLRPYINSIEPNQKKSKQRRKFVFKIDPRDISVIYFYDPELKQYFNIPYRDISHPPITIWEYREAERWLLDKGRLNIDEKAIFEGYERMREIESKAQTKTRKTRRIKKDSKRSHSMDKSLKTEFIESKLDPIEHSINNPEGTRKSLDFKPYEDIDI